MPAEISAPVNVNVDCWHHKDSNRELYLVFEMIGLEDINSASSIL